MRLTRCHRKVSEGASPKPISGQPAQAVRIFLPLPLGFPGKTCYTTAAITFDDQIKQGKEEAGYGKTAPPPEVTPAAELSVDSRPVRGIFLVEQPLPPGGAVYLPFPPPPRGLRRVRRGAAVGSPWGGVRGGQPGAGRPGPGAGAGLYFPDRGSAGPLAQDAPQLCGGAGPGPGGDRPHLFRHRQP